MIRTVDDLVDRIANELIWRRKELTDLRALVRSVDGDVRKRVLVRSGVALLYAHWEGFIKMAAAFYLEYVASRRLPYNQLRSNFVAITLKHKFLALSTSNRLSSANEIAEFFYTSLTDASNIPYKKIIDAKSNLSSSVLLDILATLGLDDTDFLTRLNFIDVNLVRKRNFIAHGEALELSNEEYIELHDNVLLLIETFRNLVENAAACQSFKR